jgi:hypothetical protein
MRALIREIEDAASLGFTAATELLLDLTIAERKKFEAALRKHEKLSLPVRTIDAKKVYIEIRDETDVPAAARTVSVLATAMQKQAVVLVLKPRLVSVQSWNTANP